MRRAEFKWPAASPELKRDLAAVDEVMLKAVGDQALGRQAAGFIKSGGKRLRPVLLITTSRLGDSFQPTGTIEAAAAFELVHLASLVHDDLLDGDVFRRHKTSPAGKSAALALLLGDFLVAKAMTLALSVSPAVAAWLAEAISTMAAAEAVEALPDFLSRAYLEQAKQKTGVLFGVAAVAGATLAGLPAEQTERVRLYAEAFGLAFQIIDDLKDTEPKPAQTKAGQLKIEQLLKAALDQLEELSTPAADSLRALPGAYLDWASPL